jgi:hypothetical protein
MIAIYKIRNGYNNVMLLTFCPSDWLENRKKAALDQPLIATYSMDNRK